MGWRRVFRGLGIALVWALVIVVAFVLHNAFPNLQEQLGISTALLVVAFGLLAYITFVRNDVAEKFGEDAYPSKKWAQSLMEGEPIKPVHAKSNGIPESGWGVLPQDHMFFRDFAAFGRMLNEWLKEDDAPWRLQEREDSELTNFGFDSPTYGRSYDVFYYQHRFGLLELTSGFEYSEDNTNVNVVLELQNPRLIPYHSIHDLYSAIALHLKNNSPEAQELSDRALTKGMLEAMWSAGPDAIRNRDLEVRFGGTATTYLHRLTSWREKSKS